MRAFTLVETLIALGILAFAVMGLLMALSNAVDAARILRREAAVRQEMENHLAKLQWDGRREFREEFPADEVGVTYIDEIVPEEVVRADHTVLDGYRRLRVTARWRGAGRQPEERQASFLVFSP